jgi:hypothetical protein
MMNDRCRIGKKPGAPFAGDLFPDQVRIGVPYTDRLMFSPRSGEYPEETKQAQDKNSD